MVYFLSIINEIPYALFVMAIVILCVFAVFAIGKRGLKRGLHYSLGALLLEYLILVICSTVVYRKFNADRGYSLTPFWSYERPELMHENLMNVVLFVPIGILLGVCFSKWPWWRILSAGCLFSVLIELAQLFFNRGFCEVDDVIHNTLGCMIGYVISCLCAYSYSALAKKII